MKLGRTLLIFCEVAVRLVFRQQLGGDDKISGIDKAGALYGGVSRHRRPIP
jgi:hypothetical protein